MLKIAAEPYVRIAALERLVTQNASSMEWLAAQHRDMQRKHEALLAAHLELAEDHSVLCQTVTEAGAITGPALEEVRRERRRAQAVRKALQAPDVACAICRCAGVRAATALASLSRTEGEGARRALPTLVVELPPHVYVCGGSAGGDALAAVERYDPLTYKWEVLPPMRVARRWCGAAAAGGAIYVFGGHNGARYLNAAERYLPDERTWEVLPSMPSPREGCAVAAMRGQLYVFGGSYAEPSGVARSGGGGEHAVCAVERLDTSSLKWELLPPMPRARDACTAAADLKQCVVFLLGGRDANEPFLPTAERFRTESFQWEALPSMPTARLGCAAATVGDALFVAGGHGGQALATLECFRFSTLQWESLPFMPTARLGCAAAATAGSLLVFGGHDGGGALSAVEIFEPSELKWSPLPRMSVSRYACTAAASVA